MGPKRESNEDPKWDQQQNVVQVVPFHKQDDPRGRHTPDHFPQSSQEVEYVPPQMVRTHPERQPLSFNHVNSQDPTRPANQRWDFDGHSPTHQPQRVVNPSSGQSHVIRKTKGHPAPSTMSEVVTPKVCQVMINS